MGIYFETGYQNPTDEIFAVTEDLRINDHQAVRLESAADAEAPHGEASRDTLDGLLGSPYLPGVVIVRGED